MTARLRAAAIACAVLLHAPAVLGDPPGKPTPLHAPLPGIIIGTGAITGVYYQVGSAICRLVERDKRPDQPEEPDLPCGAMMTEGSNRNVSALDSGSADVAIVQSDILDRAVRGTGSTRAHGDAKLRSLFSLHHEPYQLLVARHLGIASFGDLKGHKVNLGLDGSAAHAIFESLMRRYDLDEGSFSHVSRLGIRTQYSAFCNGDVEALGMTVGYPNEAYRHAIAECGGGLVALDDAPARDLIASTPAYAPAVVPAGTYPGIGGDVPTFGVVAVVVVTADMPEGVAYRIVRDVFERIDQLRAMHPALAGLDPRRMVGEGLTAPLHPGALRYFREKGLL